MPFHQAPSWYPTDVAIPTRENAPPASHVTKLPSTFGPNVTGNLYPESRTNAITGIDVTNLTSDVVGIINGGVHGAFTYSRNGESRSEVGITGGFIFNAHNSNAVYTDNGHVYPKSIALNFIIKC